MGRGFTQEYTPSNEDLHYMNRDELLEALIWLRNHNYQVVYDFAVWCRDRVQRYENVQGYYDE